MQTPEEYLVMEVDYLRHLLRSRDSEITEWRKLYTRTGLAEFITKHFPDMLDNKPSEVGK